MGRAFLLVSALAFFARGISAQEVFVARDAKPAPQAAPSASPELHVEKAIAVQPVKAEPEPPGQGPVEKVAKPSAEITTAKVASPVPFPAKPANRVVRKDTPFMTRASDSRMMANGAKPIASATPKREAIVMVPRATPNPSPAVVAVKPKKTEIAEATPAPKKVEAAAAPAPKKEKVEVVVATPASKKLEVAAATPAPKKVEVAAPKKVEVVVATPAPKKVEVAASTPSPKKIEVAAPKKVEVAAATPAPKKVEVAAATPAPKKIDGSVATPAPKKVEVAAVPKSTEKSPVSAASISAPPRKMEMPSGARISLAAAPQPVSFSGDTAFIKLADGFDFPVGKPDAQGYYKARGFRSHGHLGEDWDGVGGGDTDLGDPIYCIGDGVVVFARDCHMGWGNVLIVRHSYREGGSVRNIDSLYGHLQTILVHKGQSIARGQKIATMGNAHGLYDAHLHLEIRKNLEIGMSRAAFARDFSNYYDPTQFIAAHRHLQTSSGTYRVALNTFTHDARINWSKARNYSHAHTGGGSGESAAALKKALATTKHE